MHSASVQIHKWTLIHLHLLQSCFQEAEEELTADNHPIKAMVKVMVKDTTQTRATTRTKAIIKATQTKVTTKVLTRVTRIKALTRVTKTNGDLHRDPHPPEIGDLQVEI